MVEVSRDGKYFCRIFFRAEGSVEATAAHWGEQEGKTEMFLKRLIFMTRKLSKFVNHLDG
jgi:hypothetical protein